jgi:hypothetical protein
MRTEKQIEASRRNGARSKGPTSVEGKARSSQNALKHGACASKWIVALNEDPSTYDGLLDRLAGEFLPVGQSEELLVEQLAHAAYNIKRLANIEVASLDRKMDEQLEEVTRKFKYVDGPYRQALAFQGLAQEGSTLALLDRYQARHHRLFQHLWKALRDLQAARAKNAERTQPARRDTMTPDPELCR